MSLSPAESWLLVVTLGVLVWLFYKLICFTSEQFDTARDLRATKRRLRSAYQRNMRELSELYLTCDPQDEPLLLQAIHCSIKEYRGEVVSD